MVELSLVNESRFANATSLPERITGFSLTETYIITTVLIILILLALFGNGLVIGIFYEYTPLRSVTNYFIISLAVADILVALLSIPIWIAYVHVGLEENKFGNKIYRLWICLDITSGVASVLNLSFVSVDRYLYVTLPLKYQILLTSQRAKIIICGIWLYAVGLAMIKAIAFSWAKPNYEILVFIMGFLLPLLVMAWCYFRIFSAARMHAKAIMCTMKYGKRDFKAIRTISIVIMAFFICWCPFFLLNLLHGLFPSWRIPGEVITISKWLHYTNSVLNPIIYACFNTEYRSAFRALLTRKKLTKCSSTKFKLSRKETLESSGILAQIEES